MNNGKRTRILVLDDDKAILTAFSCLMQSIAHDYDVEFFGTPQKALEAVTLRPGDFDLVMTDIRMPGMDGLVFAESIRKVHPEVAIIFMTAYACEDFAIKVTKFRKATYLEKPFHLETVLKQTVPSLLASAAD